MTTYRPPPPGWESFGTHADTPGIVEFSEETGDDGLPLWERLLSKEDRLANEYVAAGALFSALMDTPVEVESILEGDQAGLIVRFGFLASPYRVVVTMYPSVVEPT